MKPSVFPHMGAILFLSAIAPLSAQNLASVNRSPEAGNKAEAIEGTSEQYFSPASVLPGSYEMPVLVKAQGELPATKPVYAAQDATLDTRASTSQQKVDSVVDLGVLRNPSPYRKVAVSTAGQPYEVAADSLQDGLAMISAVYREAGKREASSDCPSISLSVEQRIKLDVSKVLEIVEAEVTANPSCACEVVKTAIKASEADVPMVVSIVETSINASPDNMRIISQCAIAAMPDSITEVQALLTKLDPNSGDSNVYSSKSAKSAKSAKGAKVAAVESVTPPNPLDIIMYPPIYPPPIIPPYVTDVNPNACY